MSEQATHEEPYSVRTADLRLRDVADVETAEASECMSCRDRRPVTPEVAGSSPVAPVYQSACKWTFVCCPIRRKFSLRGPNVMDRCRPIETAK